MAEKSFPLENTVYTAEDASLWFATRTSGVHASNQLGVTAADGLSVNVGAGIAWLKYADFAGVAYANTETKMLLLGAANANYPRIDRVVIRYSRSENRVYLAVKSGNAANSPAAPDVTRNADTYEISLAQVRVNAKATSISASNITDERLNNAVCGLMTDGVTDFILDSLLINTDPTLTIEGAAADSKAVGDRFGNMLTFVQGRAPKVHAENHRFTDTLTWDGDTAGRLVYDPYGDGSWLLYHISDAVPTISDFSNGYAVTYWDYNEGKAESYYVAPDEWTEPWSKPDGAVFDLHIAISPADNYSYDEDVTFPKKGVYFMRDTFNGEDSIVTSLTIPGYAFDEGSDPITPEMIGAAPTYHAETDARHGVGTAVHYGHFRLAEMNGLYDGEFGLFNFDQDKNLIDKDGNFVEDFNEYLRNCATGAVFSYVFYRLVNLEFEYLNNEIAEIKNELKALKGE